MRRQAKEEGGKPGARTRKCRIRKATKEEGGKLNRQEQIEKAVSDLLSQQSRTPSRAPSSPARTQLYFSQDRCITLLPSHQTRIEARSEADDRLGPGPVVHPSTFLYNSEAVEQKKPGLNQSLGPCSHTRPSAPAAPFPHYLHPDSDSLPAEAPQLQHSTDPFDIERTQFIYKAAGTEETCPLSIFLKPGTPEDVRGQPDKYDYNEFQAWFHEGTGASPQRALAFSLRMQGQHRKLDMQVRNRWQFGSVLHSLRAGNYLPTGYVAPIGFYIRVHSSQADSAKQSVQAPELALRQLLALPVPVAAEASVQSRGREDQDDERDVKESPEEAGFVQALQDKQLSG